MPSPVAVEAHSLLGACARHAGYADCYAIELPCAVALSELVETFYTTRLFKLERWLIARALKIPSTDQQASELAHGIRSRFAVWQVAGRTTQEILLDAGKDQSWLAVQAVGEGGHRTRLMFGSAMRQGEGDGQTGLPWHVLLAFHRVYARLLLGAAARRLRAAKQRHPLP